MANDVSSDVMNVFWPVAKQQESNDHRRRSMHLGVGSLSSRLAVTCKASFEPPFLSPVMPYLLTDLFYDGSQQDVHEFLQRLLIWGADNPFLDFFSGGERRWHRCRACGHEAPPTFENFHGLQLPIVTDAGAPIVTVAAAVEHYFAAHLAEEALIFRCGHCSSEDTPLQCRSCTLEPTVLFVTLRRTDTHRGQQGVYHRVVPSETLQLGDATYTLFSVIQHQGPSIHAGHYTCLARYPDAEQPWWKYDDATLTAATPDQLLTSETQRSYVAFYQRVPADH